MTAETQKRLDSNQTPRRTQINLRTLVAKIVVGDVELPPQPIVFSNLLAENWYWLSDLPNLFFKRVATLCDPPGRF